MGLTASSNFPWTETQKSEEEKSNEAALNWQKCSSLIIKKASDLRETRFSSDVAQRLDTDEDMGYCEKYRLNTQQRQFSVNKELNCRIYLMHGDITTYPVTYIVNAARPSLLGGGGIDKAIHKKSGEDLKKCCKQMYSQGCRHGDCKVTPSFGDLKSICQYVIHCVGPNRDLHKEEEAEILLKRCYLQCLKTAFENVTNTSANANRVSISLPCISTGAYRFPNRKACHIALHSIRDWLDDIFQRKLQQKDTTSSPSVFDKIDKIVLVCFLPLDFLHYGELLPFYFPVH
ncbi:hypothetical protein RFI_02994 [Reticulomyxa filosa]|uniref:Macro domain-containing protein n=1 Tax=Reticulomyxa filosa TaxID=46433 RepID=X6P7B6_RETFI|nr:hypothetical protein RFI_02994 [Reticulomyxa filosa]|eukprot:ETO34101.1 hypothetical protein RFI_02994 [Reticulomyxa filosa]